MSPTPPPDKSDLLRDLATGVGASEAHHLWSLEPYGCRRRLGYQKLGRVPDFPFTGNRDTERGTYLEPIVARLYEETTGRLLGPAGCHRHNLVGALLAHPDRLIFDPDRAASGILEIKCPGLTVFGRVRHHGLPPAWILQVQHGMLAANRPWGGFAVFSAERWQLEWFDVEADAAVQRKLLAEVGTFWDEVQRGQLAEPLPASDPRCKTCPFRTQCQGEKLLALRDAAPPPGDLEQDESLTEMVADYLAASEVAEEAEAHKAEARERLTAAVGDRLRVGTPAGKVYHGVSERVTLDTARLKRDHPDLVKQYGRKSVTRSLRVYAP